ncbi:MAG: peptidase dimerization domain-containing protein, partial [Acidobacteriota bacterium]|jgi:glutamate carboxypeptidase
MREWRLEVRGRASHSGLAYWDGRSALAAAARFSLDAAGLSRPGSGPTVNVARLVAGSADFVGQLRDRAELVGTTRQLNVVPDRAVVEGELRFLKLAEGDEVLARLRSIGDRVAADFDVTTSFTSGEAVSPVDPHGPGRELVARAVALAAERGWRLEVEEDRGGISFPNFLPCTVSVPVLDGLGPVGAGMHTPEERVSLTSLSRRTVLLADLLATL